MSCNCCDTSSGNGRTTQTVGPTAPAENNGNAIIFPPAFCWRCFIFWALIAAVALYLISDGGE
jgi:hypothetical protein